MMMMMEIDVINLIKEVGQRPSLYNPGSPDYFDRNQKKTLWKEVFSQLNSNLDKYSVKEKNAFGKEVQKRWNSLRDCFRRELINQQTAPSASSGAKRKAKYRYFDQLLFLLPHTQIKSHDFEYQERSSVGNCNEDDAHSSEENLSNLANKKRRLDQPDFEEIQPEVLIGDDNNTVKNTKKTEETENRKTDYEADKFFLLSLLPSFKNSSLEEKYLLRIELMKTIMKFKKERQEMSMSIEIEQVNSLAQNSPLYECKIEPGDSD